MARREKAVAGVGVDLIGLVGRDGELAELAAFLDAIGTGGAALLLTGDPGVGKTALLDAAAELAVAKGIRVIRGSGVEYETDIGFAGLHQLAAPLSRELERLPPAQREAIEVALGLGAGPPPSRIAVLNAALSLFAMAAEEQPLLLVVDDFHVVDEASRSAMGFVARRLAGHRIGLLGARRGEFGGAFQPAGMAEFEVAPLNEASALRLLSRRFAHLPRRVLRTVARDAQGNPLALLEFAGATAAHDDRRGSGTGWGSGPGRDVRALYAARVERLPQATRDLLLLAALEGFGDIAVIEAAGGPGVLDGLAPAERDHLVMVAQDGHTVRFRHPLVRSAVVDGSTGEQRRGAHRRLADALVDQPERRGDHLARATTAPDEEVAALVELAARSSLRRGDAAGAITRLRRAAGLSPDHAVRRRRLSLAAYVAAWVAGHLEISHEIMREVRDGEPADLSPAAAAAAGFLVLVTEGDADTAHALVMKAIERDPTASGPPPAETEVALFTLTLAGQYSGRPEHWRPLVDLLARFPDASPAGAVSLGRVHHAPGATTDDALRALDEEIARLKDQAEADVVVRTALVASYLDRLPGCREAVSRVIRDGRDGGAVGSSMPALIFVALDHLHAGRWQSSAQAAAELIALCEETGYHLFAQVGHYVAAMVAAQRGDLDQCRAHCERIWDWSRPRGLRRMENCAHQAAARAALGAADFETAFRHATAICAPGELPPFNPEALWSAPDLVEAAVRSGRPDQARRHAEAVRAAGVERLSSRFALSSATITAMTARPEDAVARFEAALAVPDTEQWPFEVARAHLAFGETLRRQGLNRDARVRLAAARDRFERLGAASWQARAEAELRATGMTRTARGTSGTPLTPQELEVARLAAAGLSNPEIAVRLFLSPRTVSSHLYRVFPKLGITSRAALRDALDALAPEPPSARP
ncbi:DNA-binding CsgD family transcriptional regulator [Saccharothrix coeruleofusca]|uniref:AAA family ATPase n=1 Tax=Saccharothrix coeruleofusca TaxID=33919 RepID=UPI001AE64F08|nr:LuxR family transcriptional regulator [Saccharothrix coeruleofusca]MBP2337466.1 DNA-binding CsgD family transcriptional regulator [Saccharothrix coeruleofusca]